MLTVGPEAPASIRPLLRDMAEALAELQAPGAPTPVFACVRARLPPAADWPWRLALVTDLNLLAHSDGVRWIRQDTGGPV